MLESVTCERTFNEEGIADNAITMSLDEVYQNSRRLVAERRHESQCDELAAKYYDLTHNLRAVLLDLGLCFIELKGLEVTGRTRAERRVERRLIRSVQRAKNGVKLSGQNLG